MARIVITSFGSLGDVHPYIAISLGLQRNGHEVSVATGECYRGLIEGLGLGFHPVRPDSSWVNDPDIMKWMTHPRWGLIRGLRDLFLPRVKESYEDLRVAIRGADVLIANQAQYAARLVAEESGIRWASAMHIPMGFYSAYRPPLLPGFPVISKRLRFLGPTFWKPLGTTLKLMARPILARPWYHLRGELGLPPVSDLNPLTDGHAPALHLALFSRLLAEKQRDWPPQTLVTGFPWFDQAEQISMPRGLEQFLDSGPPPIVFTLGTAVAAAAGSFFEESVAAAQLLGQRAVLVLKHGRNRPANLPPTVVAFDYAPFSQLFPRAAVIVHQGGIGSTGLAMRSGQPALIVPCAWDQPDNADRAERLGLARTLPRHKYQARRVATEIQHLLSSPQYAVRAAAVAKQMDAEDGVAAAVGALEKLLS